MQDDTHTTTHDAEDDPRNRDIKIYVNGALKHRSEAVVSVYDSGFMLGDGMWEGMRLYNGRWAFFDAQNETKSSRISACIRWQLASDSLA